MKRHYSKPIIQVEVLQLDAPIAANCIADKEDMLSLMELGYFTEERNCMICQDDIIWGSGHDTICYHSNVQTAFLS